MLPPCAPAKAGTGQTWLAEKSPTKWNFEWQKHLVISIDLPWARWLGWLGHPQRNKNWQFNEKIIHPSLEIFHCRVWVPMGSKGCRTTWATLGFAVATAIQLAYLDVAIISYKSCLQVGYKRVDVLGYLPQLPVLDTLDELQNINILFNAHDGFCFERARQLSKTRNLSDSVREFQFAWSFHIFQRN